MGLLQFQSQPLVLPCRLVAVMGAAFAAFAAFAGAAVVAPEVVLNH